MSCFENLNRCKLHLVSCYSIWTSSQEKRVHFRRTDFNLSEICWKNPMGFQKNWLIFRDHVLQAQERPILTSWRSNKGSRRPAWRSKELLTEFRYKKEVHKMWKQGKVITRCILDEGVFFRKTAEATSHPCWVSFCCCWLALSWLDLNTS